MVHHYRTIEWEIGRLGLWDYGMALQKLESLILRLTRQVYICMFFMYVCMCVGACVCIYCMCPLYVYKKLVMRL